MNNIEILEKLKDEQYTKETLITICKFYDEKFKPYVLSTEERDALENLIQENKELKEALRSEIQAFNKMKELAEIIRKENVEYIIQNRQYELHYIPKSKIKEIIYPTPENYIPLEVQQSDMYKKLKREVED